MSDGACISEDQHRIDTLQQMANTEHQLRMARTRYESAKWELVRASEAFLEWQGQWNRERSAVFACYPDAMPVDHVLADARLTMDRFCAEQQAPPPPLDAVRDAIPAASENSGEQSIEDKFARLANRVEDAVRAIPDPEPEIPEGFMRYIAGDLPPKRGSVCDVFLKLADGSGSYIARSVGADRYFYAAPGQYGDDLDTIIAYRILEPAQEAEPFILFDEQTGEPVNPNPEPEGYPPLLDVTELPQVTADKVPPVAEVIHTEDGRKKFALFGGKTHEVVEPANTEADFWARALHPRKEDA